LKNVLCTIFLMSGIRFCRAISTSSFYYTRREWTTAYIASVIVRHLLLNLRL
jgi:hypothetical protein